MTSPKSPNWFLCLWEGQNSQPPGFWFSNLIYTKTAYPTLSFHIFNLSLLLSTLIFISLTCFDYSQILFLLSSSFKNLLHSLSLYISFVFFLFIISFLNSISLKYQVYGKSHYISSWKTYSFSFVCWVSKLFQTK